MSEQAKCQLCGEPMPAGEQMFNFHGYSGPCPKPALPREQESQTMTPVPKDSPLMLAWERYKASGDYQNTRKWATDERHVDGSLWAAFENGWRASRVGVRGEANHEGRVRDGTGR